MPEREELLVRLERLDTISNFTGTNVQEGNRGVPVPHGLMPDMKMSNTLGTSVAPHQIDSQTLGNCDFLKEHNKKTKENKTDEMTSIGVEDLPNKSETIVLTF